MSGRKNTLPVIPLISSGDMSGNLTSPGIGGEFLDQFTIQCNISGSPVGTFDVQESVDNINWASIPLDPVPTATPSPIVIKLTLESPRYVRLLYVFTSGTGTLNAFIKATQV